MQRWVSCVVNHCSVATPMSWMEIDEQSEAVTAPWSSSVGARPSACRITTS